MGTHGRARHPSPLSRRAFLAGSAATGLALAGCGAPDVAAGRARVRQWNLFGGGDGARLVQMHEQFQDEHPRTALQAYTFAWGAPFYTKLAMSAAGGRAPEVATLHLSRLRGFSPTTLLDPFPRNMLTEAGITEEKFLPDVWRRCLVDGDLYAVPLDTHPFVTYYNTEICAEAGLLDADGRLAPFSGVDGLVDALRAVREVTGQFGASVETTNPWRLWYSLYRQLDGEFFDESGTELILDDDKAVQVLTLMRDLADEGLLPRFADYPACVAMFSNGQAGLSFNGEWEVTTYTTAELPFSMAPFPDVYGSIRTAGDSHTFVLPHQRDRSTEDTRATVEYIAWMLEHSVDWAAGGHIPAYQPVATSDEYLALTPQSEYREVADDVQFDPQAWFSGSGSQMQSEAAAAFAGVTSGDLPPEQAVAQFRAAVLKLLDTPSPV
ncbi:carbohydrate ABC transporter substrate-binding protein (CUT1 family) [Haloactinopolyspora alba]|uniref:Carbohydrate ABC transporter substrate-binding protein (CUT1 family) n=1 Tax=Haloactinopolyspora alba TaxID=648780 RepID=A0A2P8E6X7_9ACTN|nr:extracellular solute-binding protein [Haloactinopolyspora alba]PSL05230.1 carbohydrate ABC transporter substrate-binding protein (CUT1 family) [Haloactinopolyspora alba]